MRADDVSHDVDAGIAGIQARRIVGGRRLLAAAGALDAVLGLPAGFLRGVGAFLVVFAAAFGVLATRASIPRAGVLVVVEANLVWALASIAMLAAGWHSPTVAGGVWIALQALVVAGFATLQYAAARPLRRV